MSLLLFLNSHFAHRDFALIYLIFSANQHKIWDIVFKNGSRKICGRRLVNNLKWYGLFKHTILIQFFKKYYCKSFTYSFNTLSNLTNHCGIYTLWNLTWAPVLDGMHGPKLSTLSEKIEYDLWEQWICFLPFLYMIATMIFLFLGLWRLLWRFFLFENLMEIWESKRV